jgi:protease-4
VIRIFFRLLSRPIAWILLAWIQFRLFLKLRNAGVLLIELEGSKAQKSPLWPRFFRRAAAHPRVKVVHLQIRPAKWGWAQLESLREAIRDVSSSGTVVVASMESADTAGMVLGSACDHLLLAPLGEVFLGGVGLEMQFLGDAMSRVGLEFEVISAGEYKSAAEPVSRAFPSRANREALTALVSDLHGRVRDQIAEDRGIDAQELQDIMEGGLLSGQEAVDAGLVDALCYEPQIESYLTELLGKGPRVLDEANQFRAVKWQAGFRKMFTKRASLKVLQFEGAIVREGPKYSPKSQITQDESLEAIEALIERPPKAVVLFVNSPGGSALVSDLIWEAVGRLNEKVPVVACFGNVSASGGYFISAGCREIVAQRNTLTGSIGVISGKLVTGKALAQWGFHSERIAGAEGGGMLSTSRTLSGNQKNLLRARIQEIYKIFKNRVEDGRGMAEADVEAVAQGRVWTGDQASKCGLVDHLGGLDVAMERAAVLGGFSLDAARISLKKVEKSKPVWARFMLQAPLGMQATDLQGLLVQQLNLEAQVLLSHPAEPLALCPIRLS